MTEKEEFSQRLIVALRRLGVSTMSATKLAIDFNLHHQGRPVSTQAAHKWLNGSAIPGQDKLRSLAQWLGVSPEWLRYGTASTADLADGGKGAFKGAGVGAGTEKSAEAATLGLRQEMPSYPLPEERLVRGFRQLSEPHQQAVLEMVSALLRADKNKR